jgi:YHYH protein/Secretion system C-terminal sorting domain
MNTKIALFILCWSSFLQAQTNPAITSWLINKSEKTGFDGIKVNVQQVQYSDKNVYVSTTNIASWIPLGYDWPNNPWSPKAQNFVFKITLNPTEKPVNKVITPYGHIGIWTNGVSIYNPKDAKSWQDSLTWFQNAFYFEHQQMETFDPCFGHPNNKFEYHLHVNPDCLYDAKDSSKHSLLIGFAFDGFPIYGAYSFAKTDGTGAITRMKSSYRLRTMTDRTTLPNGTVLSPTKKGPPLSAYPLGAYCEDFEYITGLGNLDENNGRFCKTPEYPNGIYAYFVTLDAKGIPAYPYVLGKSFHGVVQQGNMGPNSGFNPINEPVTVYSSTATNELAPIEFNVFPNPTSGELNIFIPPSYQSNMTISLYNCIGQTLKTIKNVQSSLNYSFDLGHLPKGVYVVKVASETAQSFTKIVLQ